jgi:outer membrane protein assembly factor BamB
VTARRRVAILLAATAPTLACATSDRADDRVNAALPLWMHHPSGAIQVIARRQLAISGLTSGEDYERGRPALDPEHGRVFVGTADHGLYALRSSDGSSIWRFETLAPVQSEPLYDPVLDVVYFGSNDGALYAVHARDGALVFRFMTGAEVSRSPAISGDLLFVANGADQLFAIDRRTGKQRWNVHRGSALGMEVAGYAGPLADRGKVYMAFSDGHVGAYDATDGTERWTPVDLSAEAEQSAGGEAPRYLDVDTTPVVDELPTGRVVYVASYAGGVFALDAETGARVWVNDKAVGVTELVLWTEPAHAPSPFGPYAGGPIVPARKLLLATSSISGLWALDLDPARAGQVKWRVSVPEGGITAPCALAGALLVGTTRYGLFALSPLDGKAMDGLDLGTGFAETPAAFGDRAFTMSNAGTFLGVQVQPPIVR